MRDATRQRRREDALKLKVLRAQIRAGIDALDRGEFVELDDAALEGYFERLSAQPDKPAR